MILETKNLIKRYGHVLAVDRINLHVHENSVYGLLGPNGAGKTTILGICTTLIKPTSGDVIINGFSINKDPGRVRESIGLLPQESEFYPNRTPQDHLEYYAKLSGVDKDNANQMINLIGLEKKSDYKVRELSHGMIKLLGIAQALIGNPKVVFLDEPIAGLDPKVAYKIKDVIKRYSKKTTIILSSHYLEAVEKLCSHVGILKEGKLIKEGKLKDIKKGRSLESVFLSLA